MAGTQPRQRVEVIPAKEIWIGSFPCNFLISLNAVYTLWVREREGVRRERERERWEEESGRNVYLLVNSLCVFVTCILSSCPGREGYTL